MFTSAVWMSGVLATLSLVATPAGAGRLAGASAQAQELAVRLYDLNSVIPAVHVGAYEARLAPLLAEFDEDDNTIELERESGADTAARILAFLFEQDLKVPGCELRVEGEGRIRITAPQAVHRQFEPALAALSSYMRRTVEVRLDLLERPADAPLRGGLVSLADADKLIASGAKWSATVRAPRGRVGVIDASQLQQIVAGYDVEVAELTAQFKPRVESLRSGARWALRAVESPAGVRLALSTQSVSLGTIRQRELILGGFLAGESGAAAHTSAVKLQLPSARVFAAGLNLFIPTGQALVIDGALELHSTSARETWVIRCTPSGAEAAGVIQLPGRPLVRLLDTSWIEPPRAIPGGDSSGFEIVGDARGLEWAHGGDRGLHVRLQAAPLGDLLASWSERSRELLSFGPFAIALCREGDESPFVGGAQLSAPASAAAQLAWTLRRRGSGEPLTVAAGVTALLVGETSAWVQGSESRIVVSADVEIASRVGTIEPRVASALDGLIFWARPARTTDGGLECELAIAAHILAAPMRQTQVGAPLTLELDQGQWDVLNAQETLRATKPGEAARALFTGGGGLELEVVLAPLR